MPKQPKARKEGSGGLRPGSGRRKGSKNLRTTLREEIAEEYALRHQIAQEVRMLLPLGVRKKGLKALEDITLEEIEKDFKRRVGHSAHKLLNAQMSLALGTQTLFKAERSVSDDGKVTTRHVIVTNPDEIARYLDDPTMMNGVDYYYITTKQPDNNAINSALDRLFGKATSKVVGANNPDGSEGPIKVIVANFSADKALEAPAADAVIEHVVTEAISEAVADQSSSPDQPLPDESTVEEMGYKTQQYGN